MYLVIVSSIYLFFTDEELPCRYAVNKPLLIIIIIIIRIPQGYYIMLITCALLTTHFGQIKCEPLTDHVYWPRQPHHIVHLYHILLADRSG